MPIICSNCSFNNPPGMRFCGNCGSPLSQSISVQAVKPPQSSPLETSLTSDMLELLQISQLGGKSERRNVTILFTDLAGYTAMSGKLDSEEVYRIIQDYSRLLADSVYKYDGMVDKFTGDGLMAIFGAPITQENNAEMAIRAALDMQVGIDKVNKEIRNRLGIELQMRVGLNAGPVIVGNVGSQNRMEYTAIGNTVNLASRLEQAAKPGTILTSESVYQQTKGLFEFEAVPPLTLKGIPEPVQAYRVVAIKQKPASTRGLEGVYAPLIGRETELAKLNELLKSLLSQHKGGIVFISGEAGIGKSRLLSEFRANARPEQARILEGNSLNYRRSVPYWIFRDLLNRFLDISANLPEAEIHERLERNTRRVLGDRAGEILPYLEFMMATKPSDPAAVKRLALLEADQLRRQIHIAVRDLLIAEAQQRPLLIFLEDLHWADDASLDLLSFLLDSVPTTPILILGIFRPTEHQKLVQIIEKAEKNLSDWYFVIQLHHLSDEQSAQLLTHLLNLPQLPTETRNQILSRAAGIPFYIEEMVRVLIDNNIVQLQDSQWQLVSEAALTSIGIPNNVEALILARFDKLHPLQRKILQAASVIGRQFNLELLSTVLAITNKDSLNEAISNLVGRQFISPQSDEPTLEYTFNYALVAEVIYGTLLKTDRSELHGKVGEAIEQLYSHRLDEYIEVLARHYAWSNNYEKALHYLLLSGQKAWRNYANEQARHHFLSALEILPKAKHTVYQELSVLTGLGDVLLLMGEHELARDQFQSAYQVLERLNPLLHTVEKSTLLRKLATTHEREGEYDQALLLLLDAQKYLETSPIAIPSEMSKIFHDAGWIYFRRGDHKSAEKNLLQALELAENTPQLDIIASIYNRLGGVYFQNNQLEKASEYVRKSLEIRDKLGDILAVARSHNNLGLLEWKLGRWENALDSFNRSLALNAKIGDVEAMILIKINIALLLTDMGRVEEARQKLEESLVGAQKIGHPFLEASAHLQFGYYWRSLQEWQKALDACNESLKIFNKIGSQENLIDLYYCMGEAWLGLGKIDEASQICDQALNTLSQQSDDTPSLERGMILRLRARIAIICQQFEQAEQFLSQSTSDFIYLNNDLELARTYLVLANLHFVRGNEAKAKELLAIAKATFQRLGAHLDLANIALS